MKNLNIGDVFELGFYNDRKLKWKVLEKDDEKLYALCTQLTGRKVYNKEKDRHWAVSSLRKWLNGEFYDTVFSEEEKGLIKKVNCDNVTLMTKAEADTIISAKDRKVGTSWWLRSPHSTLYMTDVSAVSKNGYITGEMIDQSEGIRPVLYIDQKKLDVTDDTADEEDYIVTDSKLMRVRKNIVKADVPYGIGTIDDDVFDRCGLLTEVTLPDTLTEIPESLFFYCRSLETIYVRGVKINISDLKSRDEDLDIILNMILKCNFDAEYDNTVKYKYITDYYLCSQNAEAGKYIADEFLKILTAFIKSGDDEKIKQLTEREEFFSKKNINKIIEKAFSTKSFQFIPAFLEYKDKLKGFKLDEIEKYLKYAENNLEVKACLLDYRNKYFTDEQLEEIRTENFEKEFGLKERTEADWRKLFTYKKTDEGIIINRYKGEEPTVTIPDMIGKNPVIAIGKYAFSPSKKGTKPDEKERFRHIRCVSLGSNIKSIGECAFDGCSELFSINIPEGVTEIGLRAFYGCRNLESVNLPDGLTVIEHRSFSDCCSLKEIKLPSGITEIGENAFEGSNGLEKVFLNDGLTSIRAYAFKFCSKISEVIIPEGVTFVGFDAFEGCTALRDISIPESLKRIQKGAFSNTAWIEEQKKTHGLVIVNNILVEAGKDLKEVIVPDGVKTILWGAFKNCSLEKITCPDSLEDIEHFAFDGCTKLKEVYLPNGTEVTDYSFQGCINIRKIMIGDEVADISRLHLR